MLPWTYGFHWSAANLIFLGAFYAVVLTVLATIAVAWMRSRGAVAAGRAEQVRWHSDFEQLPARDRVCRHVLTGEFAYRECPNAFDCRGCQVHARLMTERPPGTPKEPEEDVFGMSFPLDRYYHRGHTWVRPEPDGTATVGISDLGRRLAGVPDAVDLPRPGTRVHVNESAWRIRKRGARLRMLSPVDGEVVETGGPDREWYLRVKPLDGQFDLRHLLAPGEVRGWVMREMERLQLALSAEGEPALADGGVPLEIVAGDSAEAEAALAEMFLEP